MNLRTTVLLAASLTLTTLQAGAAEPAVNPPKPSVIQPAAPAPQPAVQSGMENYSMTGMSGDQKARLAQTVKRDRRQLGHGMGGLGDAKPVAKPAKKANAKPVKKTRKGIRKQQRRRIHR
ncbi:MAG: hypothetical protein JNK22_14920 [Rhodocyclaceae bacterium]|nr:hypothetical protein [Rhodocyclaceae bacterium]